MKFLILMGSPRKSGNTAAFVQPFIDRLSQLGAETEYVALADLRIEHCKGCGHCQDVQDAYGCLIHDDMETVVEKIGRADCLVLATPIYSWHCTSQMKALMDRHYGMNKYYGSATGSLWEGKALALITTHGYAAAYANSPLEDGTKRLCKHSKLRYLGLCSARDLGTGERFMTPEAEADARVFAEELVKRMDSPEHSEKEIIIEGKRFHDMEGFYREMGRLLNHDPDFQPGHNLDALNDLLCGGFGAVAPGDFLTIRWHDFTKSLQDLSAENVQKIIQVMESSRPNNSCVVNTKD
ncbi:MAG: NAD(P)H-dependent oxidoreductase [Eubacteriales bacterium]|nr:NAD(P)H-dependent oxidoreductase [Eubacteriales bacterium]